MATPVLSAEQINFPLLNFIHSALQGKFAFYNILLQLKAAAFSQAELELTKEQIKKIAQFNKQYQEGIYYLRKTSPVISAEEEYLFAQLKSLKNDYSQGTKKILEILSKGNWSQDPENVTHLIAWFGWHSYQDDNFFKRLNEYHQQCGHREYFAELRMELDNTQNNIKLTGNFIRTLKQSTEQSSGFYDHLSFFLRPLTGQLLAWVHECNQLLAMKSLEFTFAEGDFTQSEIRSWESSGFGAIEAGYWRAYGFSPEESASWKTAGFLAPKRAVSWKSANFDPPTALRWYALRFSPLLAIQWGNAGVPPEAAAILISHGYNVPADLPADPEKVKSLLQEGFKK